MKALEVIGGLIMAAVLVVLSAFTISTLWAWFIVPLGASAIGMAHAYGLGVIVTYFKFNIARKEREESFANQCGRSFVLHGMTLLVGYIVTLFM